MAKKRIDRNIDTDAGVVTFTELASGESLVCDLNVLFPAYAEMTDIQKRLVAHAVNAKVGDSAADPTKDTIPQLRATYETLVGGAWGSRGDGSGGGGKRITDLVTAVFNVMLPDQPSLTEEAVAEAVANWSDDKKKEVRDDPRVAAELESIRTERAKARLKAKKAAAKEATGTIVL